MYQLTPAEEKMVEDMIVRMAQKAEEEKEEKWAVFHHPLFDNLVEGSIGETLYTVIQKNF